MILIFDIDVNSGDTIVKYHFDHDKGEQLTHVAAALYHLTPPITSMFATVAEYIKVHEPALYAEYVKVLQNEEPVVPPEGVV